MTAQARRDRLLDLVRQAGLPAPYVVQTHDGEYGFHWVEKDTRASICLEEDGGFGCAMFKDGAYVPADKDGNLDDARLPDDFVQYLFWGLVRG